jgi:hypothetical protein
VGSSTGNLRDFRDKPEGISSAADLLHLPPNQYSVMSLLITPREMAYSALCEAIKTLPEPQRLTQAQLDGTLFELVKEGYLTSFMENGDVVYMVQLRKGKRPSKRDEQRLWNKFDMGLDELDLNLNLPGLERLKTPGGLPGLTRFNLGGRPATPSPRPTTPPPPPPALPPAGIQRFHIPAPTPPAAETPADTTGDSSTDQEDARRKPRLVARPACHPPVYRPPVCRAARYAAPRYARPAYSTT